MRLKGQAYSGRLESYSHSTLELIAELVTMSREVVYEVCDITTDSELSEEEVVERLEALLKADRK